MKHTLKVTFLLIFIFLIAQAFGLATVSQYIEVVPKGTIVDGEPLESPQIVHNDTVVGEAPEFNGPQGLITVIIAITMGTILLLILARYKKVRLWKFWFFISVVVTCIVSLDIYVPRSVAIVLSLLLASIKIWKPHILIHNFTEVLMYTGIAILFVSFFDVVWAIVLLIVISLYDMYAVWKSKHMITLAKFTLDSKLFAGISIPYQPVAQEPVKISSPQKTAVLGGGDIAFPLIFSSVVMEHLIVVNELSKVSALFYSLIISLTTALALLLLFILAKKDRFYPAMPLVSAGAITGYGIILLLL